MLSKKRRDLINAEIRELQNLLPLKKSARERLSYLGILALTNTFIRKATFFKKGKPTNYFYVLVVNLHLTFLIQMQIKRF